MGELMKPEIPIVYQYDEQHLHYRYLHLERRH
jgi:hypothetical protein